MLNLNLGCLKDDLEKQSFFFSSEAGNTVHDKRIS